MTTSSANQIGILIPNTGAGPGSPVRVRLDYTGRRDGFAQVLADARGKLGLEFLPEGFKPLDIFRMQLVPADQPAREAAARGSLNDRRVDAQELNTSHPRSGPAGKWWRPNVLHPTSGDLTGTIDKPTPLPADQLPHRNAAGSGPSQLTSNISPPMPAKQGPGLDVGTTRRASAKALAMPQASPSIAMPIEHYPRPANDNGFGMHWIPIVHTSDDNVDRFVDEAAAMNVKWMVFLNENTNIGQNDYLVRRLTEKGIEPIMRVYTPPGQPITGDIEAMVRHYKSLGVDYYQLYNEPNLIFENAGRGPDPVQYVEDWIPAAESVVDAGGLPGFGSLSPGGNYDDLEYLDVALEEIVSRGRSDVLDRAWLSMHNYTFNHPIDYLKDSNGFMKFRWYDDIVNKRLGRSMPIIGTEGGTFIGNDEDKTLPPVDEATQVRMVKDAYRYMKEQRDPHVFAYSYWVIANEAGGGHDRSFSNHALIRQDYTSPIVTALRELGATTSRAPR